MYKVEYWSKKNFELTTRSSVPGLTAIQDSEWLALKGPDRHVPASGTREPGGTGYPPPVVGELATTLVNGALALQGAPPTPLAADMAPNTSAAAASAASTPGSLLMFLPPLATSLALGLPRPQGGYQRPARNTGDRAGTSAAARSPRRGARTRVASPGGLAPPEPAPASTSHCDGLWAAARPSPPSARSAPLYLWSGACLRLAPSTFCHTPVSGFHHCWSPGIVGTRFPGSRGCGRDVIHQ